MNPAIIKEKIKQFLSKVFVWKIRETYYNMTVEEGISFKESLAICNLWLRGVPRELELFYSAQQVFDETSFWGASSSVEEIRKIHLPMPSILVNTLVDFTSNDLLEMKLDNEIYDELWKKISKDNDIEFNLNKFTKDVLVYGDGCFKIGFKSNLQDTPYITFVKAEDVEYLYEDNRLKETIFKKEFKVGNLKYYLLEFYGNGYIKYKLFNSQMIEVPLGVVDELKDLKDITFIDESGNIDYKMNLAIPFKIWDSDIYEGRGKSIYLNRVQEFDALDEIYSTWIDASRKGLAQRYIPSDLVPKDKNGLPVYKNDFRNTYIQLESNGLDESTGQVQLIQPVIDTNRFTTLYSQTLEQILEGLISPSTLGINSRTLDTAESQREREKTSLRTREAIIDALDKTLQKLVRATIRFECYESGVEYNDDYGITIAFNEYANPSFEAKIDALSKGAPNRQIISYEKIVNELYPNLSNEEKQIESDRLYIVNRGIDQKTTGQELVINEDGSKTLSGQTTENVEEHITEEDKESSL